MTLDEKYKYLAKNTILFTISSFGSKLLVFLLVPLYTSVLSTAEYGTADFITTTATLLIYTITLNIYDAVMRFAIDQKTNQEVYLRYGLMVLSVSSIILATGLYVCYISGFFRLAGFCYLFLLLQFVSLALNQILGSFLRALDRVKEVAISGVITTVTTVGLNIILLIGCKAGLYGYLISMVSGNIASSLYSIFVMQDRIPMLLRCRDDKKTRLEMRRYSIPLIFNNVAWWMNSSIDKYFIIGILGQSMNGIYAVSQKIPTIMSIIHSIFSQAWNLSAFKEFDKENRDGFFSNAYTIYNALLVIICSGLILINIGLARVLFAKEFFVGWEASSILLLSTVFSSLGGFVGSIFSAVKNTKIYAVSTVSAAVINCVLNATLIPNLGIVGAAIATVISFFFIWAVRLFCTKKYITWRFSLIKDLVAYGLLVIQIVLEHTSGHGYLGQIVVFVAIIVLYHKRVMVIVRMLMEKITGQV